MNRQELGIEGEARLRLACCKAETGDGWGERRSLRNHMMIVDRRIAELDAFANEIKGLPADDVLRLDDITVDLMNEYRRLLIVKKAVCEFFGEPMPQPVLVAAAEKRNLFAEFIEELLER